MFIARDISKDSELANSPSLVVKRFSGALYIMTFGTYDLMKLDGYSIVA